MGGEGLLGSVIGTLGQCVETCSLIHLVADSSSSYEVVERVEKIQDRQRRHLRVGS